MPESNGGQRSLKSQAGFPEEVIVSILYALGKYVLN